MAYGLRYFHNFKNNVLDVYRIEIYEKDYTGNAEEITTTGSPIKLKYQSGEDRPITSIRASEAEINFYSETFLSLLNFYSEDDEKYRIDFILVSIFAQQGNVEFYSGTADIEITNTAINIEGQISGHDIEAGMIITLLGQTYEILDVEYSSVSQTISIFVDGALPAGIYPAENFTIYEYVPTVMNELKWRGFLLQDNSSEEFQDPPYTIRIVATDNIALLKDITFDVATEGKYTSFVSIDITMTGPSAGVINNLYSDPNIEPGDIINIGGSNYTIAAFIYVLAFDQGQFTIEETIATGDYTGSYNITGDLVDKLTLWDFFRICIQATGVVLPVRIFNSLYETTQDTEHDMFKQTRLFSGMFLDSEGVWQDCYSILENILFRFNATLIQADGFWNIVRMQELRNGPLTGFSFDENWENETAVTLDRSFEIKLLTDICFIGADATRSINRPDKFSKETFNYVQPKQLLRGTDLQTLGAFIGSSTAIEDGVSYRYDRYEIPDFWTHENSLPQGSGTLDASYIVVKTNITENVEVERYVYQPFIDHNFKTVEFDPLPVTTGDSFNLTMQVKTMTTAGGDVYSFFRIRFLIITAAGHEYSLTQFSPGGGDAPYLRWSRTSTDPVITDGFWKSVIGSGITVTRDDTRWSQYDLSNFTLDETRPKVPPIPADGMLRVGIQGFTNSNPTFDSTDGAFKDIRIEFTYTFGDSLNIIGHTHKQEQPELIKNNFDEGIKIDDAPRSTIAGTLFLDVLTNFLTQIGSVYFTKTQLWGTGQKLGEIITQERKQLTKKPRTVIDGRVYGMRKGSESITPLSVITIFTLQNLNFIFGVCEFDYYSNVFSATKNELYENGEDDVDADYEFKYLYETT